MPASLDSKQRKVVRFSDTSELGRELGSRLGDNDPDIQPLPSDRSSSGDSQIEEIKLHIPDLKHTAQEDVVDDNNNEDDRQFLEHLLDVDKIENGHFDKEKYSPKENNTEQPLSERTNRVPVTSKNYLKDKLKYKKNKKTHEKTVYLVRTVPQPSNKYIGKETNVTAVLNKPIVTPFIENAYTRVDSGYSSRPQTYSGNSIKRLNRAKANNNKMSSYMNKDIYTIGNMGNVTTMSGVNTSMGRGVTTVTRVHEKEELQRLNDRFSAYVSKVRQMSDGSYQDSGAFIKSAKILEEELANLRNLYERELESVRQQLDSVTRERNSYQVQFSKNQQTAADMQDRLSIETDKNRKLMDEMNMLQKRISNMEAELTETRMASSRPLQDIQHLQKEVDNFTRENETLKRRWEKEQLQRQEAEERLHQSLQKMQFADQVNTQQTQELRERLENSTATILSLEARVRDSSKVDSSIPDLLKQVREAAEEELRKYQLESEEQYNRNIAALKAQMDNDAQRLERINTEKTQLLGSIGELRARITSLEGQIHNLEHQRISIEEMMQQERKTSAEQIQALEKKLHDVQEMLFVKMREANVSRDASVPLKAEIEAMKILLEEEEKRLQAPVNVTSYSSQTRQSLSPTLLQTNISQSYVPPQPSAPPMSPAPLTTTFVGSARMESPIHANLPDQFYSQSAPPEFNESQFPGHTTKYSYETTPGVNKLQIDPSPPPTPRPVGPITRVKSAPDKASLYSKCKTKWPKPSTVFKTGGTASGRTTSAHLVSTSLGQGKDYFDEMFRDLTRETLYTPVRPKSSPGERYQSSVNHDYTTSTSRSEEALELPPITNITSNVNDYSAVGDIKILEVNQDGRYIRLVNEGKQDMEFGGYMLQQNVGGHPVAVYRFPPRTKFPCNGTVTVWSASAEAIVHQPPSDYVWKEQQKWGTGPECTTILCKPNGQAIAWTTAAHRFARNPFEDSPEPGVDEGQELNEDETLTEMTVNINQPKEDSVYLRREKQQPATLSPQKHPHGISPGKEVHPHTGQSRPLTYGNDNSSLNRQSRSQSTRPDPVQGQPYSGPSGQRMGSAPMRKYSASQNVRGNGQIVKQSDGVGETSSPPSSFMTPHNRFEMGLKQVQSQHNTDFLPPMPRPPLFSAW